VNPIKQELHEKALLAILFFLTLSLNLTLPAFTFGQDHLPPECQRDYQPMINNFRQIS
jgi:hypothetical protein